MHILLYFRENVWNPTAGEKPAPTPTPVGSSKKKKSLRRKKVLLLYGKDLVLI